MKKQQETKGLLHPRSKHRDHYDFNKLTEVNPKLKDFVAKNKFDDLSVDFFNAKAVLELNKSLLQLHYNLKEWSIPENFLCPPIPGRADYIHYAADLLSEENDLEIPKGNSINCMDIGTGASCIYPLIGNAEYSWNFVGTDINSTALKAAQNNVTTNNKQAQIVLTLQKNKESIFEGLLKKTDRFDLCLCNPPFHSSAEEAAKSSMRKNSNLKNKRISNPALNFGGQSAELWCSGGDYGFIQKMVTESELYQNNFLWFTVLVSKGSNLRHFEKWLEEKKVSKTKIIEMKQGQKVSRLLCWTFLNSEQRNVWTKARWK